MTTPLLEVRNVNQRFGGLLAVSDVSFDLFEGEILGLIGPNGAGKTTLFNVVNGVYKPSQGSVKFAGHDITGVSPYKVVHLGLARTHQIVKPLNAMSVLDNVTGDLRAAADDDGVVPANDVEQLIRGRLDHVDVVLRLQSGEGLRLESIRDEDLHTRGSRRAAISVTAGRRESTGRTRSGAR